LVSAVLFALTIGIDPIGVTVRDLEQSRRFVCACLGWRVAGENAAYPAVFASDGHDRVTLRQGEAPESCVAFDHRRNVGLYPLHF
jgi:catechol 2,3-dioxygenase-like lactoylglutathione lyase family enzyme